MQLYSSSCYRYQWAFLPIWMLHCNTIFIILFYTSFQKREKDEKIVQLVSILLGHIPHWYLISSVISIAQKPRNCELQILDNDETTSQTPYNYSTAIINGDINSSLIPKPQIPAREGSGNIRTLSWLYRCVT